MGFDKKNSSRQMFTTVFFIALNPLLDFKIKDHHDC